MRKHRLRKTNTTYSLSSSVLSSRFLTCKYDVELQQKPGEYKGPFGWRGQERVLTRLKMIEEQRFHSVGESMLVQKEKEGEENDIYLITLFYIYLRLYILHTHTHIT